MYDFERSSRFKQEFEEFAKNLTDQIRKRWRHGDAYIRTEEFPGTWKCPDVPP